MSGLTPFVDPAVDFETRNVGWLERAARMDAYLKIESDALKEAGFPTSYGQVTGREYRFCWGGNKIGRGRIKNFSVDGDALSVYVSAQFLGDNFLLYFTRKEGKWVAYVKEARRRFPEGAYYVEGDFELL